MMLAVDGSRYSRLTDVLTSRPIFSRGTSHSSSAFCAASVAASETSTPSSPKRRVDAGDFAQHVHADAEAIQHRAQALVDLLGGESERRVDMRKAGNGYVLEHGNPDLEMRRPSRQALQR